MCESTHTPSVNSNIFLFYLGACTFSPLMNSPDVPAGSETAPTSQALKSIASPIPTSFTGLSLVLTVPLAALLSLFGLCVLAIYWSRRRRTASKAPDERPSEKDVEALTTTRLVIPVTPAPDVRWAPQIRSISGPALDDKGPDKNVFAAPRPKRARSPPPLIKLRNQFLAPHAKTAPAHALSSSQNETYRAGKSLRDLSPSVTPQALAVSGMQTRSLGRPG
ncbi:hypothetical protein JVT61DRAFT_2403 [Boletus reticuloceps]|uniref:Uncharacterized protein n=1 Tax=Boletus reticuloceps TaxID=495285 RepID=A0A8I2YTF7_9AGAM|nr:hypothetical protein JVT61DRAFT_2403 [Boletus reticuloceps]